MPARIDDLLVLNANLNKTDFAKYLRDRGPGSHRRADRLQGARRGA